MTQFAAQPPTDPLPPGWATFIEISTSVRAYAARAMRPSLTDEELGWLQRLAPGDRVLDIALDSGLSERTMHRGLQQLWPKLDAHGRADGMITATRLGLLNPPADTR